MLILPPTDITCGECMNESIMIIKHFNNVLCTVLVCVVF